MQFAESEAYCGGVVKPKRVTLSDLAAEAGLSTTTVSDALAGRGRMSVQTRERVREIARRTGYVASSVARSLRSGSAGAIGLYLPEETIGLDYYLQLCRGAAERALHEGYALTLVPAWDEPERIADLHLDAVIVSDPSTDDPLMDTIRKLPVPLITCERDLGDDEGRVAGVLELDHRGAVFGLLDRLRERGARTVTALIPPASTGFGVELRRWFTGYEGLDVTVRDVGFATDPDQLVIEVQAALRDSPDALVSTPEGSAKLALDVVMEQGISVPGDMLFAAYTDAPTHTFSRPAITAVDLAPRLTGRRAVEMVLNCLSCRDVDSGPLIPTVVMHRATTGERVAK